MCFNKEDYGFITDCKATYYDDIDNKYKQYKWYTCWINMIKRCYDENNPNYKNYGAKGIFVDDSFKKLSDFKEFYIKNNPNNDLEMDKDILGFGFYGKSSVIFVEKKYNVSESTKRNINIHIDRMKKNIGEKHHKYKNKEWYKENPCTKSNFKKICRTQGWDYDKFLPIDSGNRAKDRHILYYFVEQVIL